MNKKELTLRLEQNIKSKFSYIPRIISSMDVITGQGSLIINSNLESDMFNIICSEENNNLVQVETIIDYFREENVPAAWWIGFQSDPKGLEEKLESMKFKSDEAELAMATSLADIRQPCSDGISINKVNNKEMLADFISVIGSLLPNEANAITEYFTRGSHIILHPESRLKLFVGYVNEKPVSTSTVFLSENVAGIFDVIALPEVQRKGVGSAMTIEAMKEGKRLGYNFATLTATNDAKFVYKKLGFEELKEMRVYSISIESHN